MYEIINDGHSNFYIVNSNFSDDCERFAASELQKYIYQSTNVCIPYFSDRCEKTSPEIIVGATARNFAENHHIELDSLGDEGYVIKTVGQDILISGKTSRGTMYGVYAFLEKFLGFRAFTKDVEKIDFLNKLVIKETEIREKPAFEYREAYFRFAFDGSFCAKNKLNSTLADISKMHGGSFKFYNCHHSFEDLLPPQEYFDSNPEYYALIDGKRTTSQLCLSNPEVLKIAIKTVRKWIENNPHCKVFSVAQSDNMGYCRCEECRKIDEYEESPSGSIIRFVNAVAEDVCKDYPDILIHTFAYTYSKKAPKYVKPHKNVIVRLCNIECGWGLSFEKQARINPQSTAANFLENINQWSKICKHLYIWDYAVNFSNYLQPFPNFTQMAENIRCYYKNEIKGVLQQGNFSYGGGAAMDDLKSYLISKLLWNPMLNEWEIIDEFCDSVYGKGSEYIKEYLRLVSDAAYGKELTINDMPDAQYITDDLIEKSEALFLKAELAAEKTTEKNRIRRESLSIQYIKITRIKDDCIRSISVDKFAKDIKEHKLTEIMERIDLEKSFKKMKDNLFTKDRTDLHWLYYIIR